MCWTKDVEHTETLKIREIRANLRFRFADADLVFVGMVYGLPCDYTESTDNHYECKECDPFHHKASNLYVE
jgi:hypothetical protein